MKELDIAEKAWLAGVIDADGSVILRQRTDRDAYSATLKIANNDEGIVDKVESLLPESRTYENENTNYDSETWYQIVLAKKDALLPVLKQVEPYLESVKSEKAQIVIRYLEIRNSKLRNRENNGTFSSESTFGADEDELYNQFTSVR